MSVFSKRMSLVSSTAVCTLCVSLLASPFVLSQDANNENRLIGNSDEIDTRKENLRAKIVHAAKYSDKNIDFASYLVELKRRVTRVWLPPVYNSGKKVSVVFKILKDGELSNLHVTHSSGVKEIDDAGLQAIAFAAPFKPLPEGVSDSVSIEFEFDQCHLDKKSHTLISQL